MFQNYPLFALSLSIHHAHLLPYLSPSYILGWPGRAGVCTQANISACLLLSLKLLLGKDPLNNFQRQQLCAFANDITTPAEVHASSPTLINHISGNEKRQSQLEKINYGTRRKGGREVHRNYKKNRQ